MPATYELNRALKVNEIFVTKIENLVLSVKKCSFDIFSTEHLHVYPFIGTVTKYSDRAELFNCSSTQNDVEI